MAETRLCVAIYGASLWGRAAKEVRQENVRAVPDGPLDEPYRVYTAEFDVEMRGRDAEQRLLAVSPDYADGWIDLGRDRWQGEIRAANRLVEEHRERFESQLAPGLDFGDCAVVLLVDQSGSMKDDSMRWAAASCRLATEALQARGCEVEILGFSTAGWRGGFAYQKWLNSGRPKRPGRLCALLHLIYKSFEEGALDEDNWQAMLNPNVLRENVDGEALLWAAQRLRLSRPRSKHLMVLSDGAPVDDATLTHNGVDYLVRHLRRVISDLEAEGSIQLSAIGLRYAVDQYYRRSVTVDDVSELPTATAKWLLQMGHVGRRSDTSV